MQQQMKSRIILFSGILFFLAIACNSKKDIQTEEYLIYIDSIQHADTVVAGQAFQLAFYGIIGPDGCSSFDRFEYQIENNKAGIMVIGKRKTGAELACPEYLPMLDGEKLQLKADSTGVFTIEVENPGLNNYLRSTITIIP